MDDSWIVALGVSLVGLYVGFRSLLYLRKTRNTDKANRAFWRRLRIAERDRYLEGAKRSVKNGLFDSQRAGEDVWSYASRFRESLYTGPVKFDHAWATFTQTLKPFPASSLRRKLPRLPRLPPLPSMRLSDVTTVSESPWTTIQTFWFSIEANGVVHRGAILRHDGLETPVLFCDVDVYIARDQLREHLEGTGPLVTCLRCFGMNR